MDEITEIEAPSTCLGQLVAALTEYYAKPLSRNMLVAGLPLSQGVIEIEQLPIITKRAGLTCTPVYSKPEQWQFLDFPLLLILDDHQSLIILEKTKTQFKVLTATGGIQFIDIELIKDLFSGKAYCLQPSIEHQANKHYKPSSGHWLWSLAFSQKRYYFEAAAGSVVINILALALPFFIMAIYDRIIPNFAIESLIVMAVGMLLIGIIDFTLKTIRAYILDISGRRLDTFLGNQVFNHLLYARLQHGQSSGSMANAIRELDTLREFINSSTLALFSDIPFLVLFLWVIYFIGGNLVIVPMILVPIILFIFLLTQWPLHQLTKKAYANASHRNSVLFEILNGMESIKALGAENWAATKWEAAHAAGVKTAFTSRFYMLINQNLLAFSQSIATVSLMIMGVFAIKEGDLSFGALFAVVILNGRIMAPISQIAQIIGRLHVVLVAYQSISRLMEMPQEITEDNVGLACPDLQGNIQFAQVNFSYPLQGQLFEAKIEVLKSANFNIQTGEKVGIVGSIGCGKSTLLKLILNIIAPESGTIRIDGLDTRELNPADYRSQIGYVSQTMHFFSGSVKENLTIHAPNAPDDQILNAIRIAGLDRWLEKLPLGLAQPIGERGDLLSGGQKQSLALARALINNPKILLMDEPTSLLDSQSEQFFIQLLSQFIDHKTLIVATHRPAILSLVDRILVLDQCQIVMDGPKQVVLDKLAGKQ